MLRWFCTFVLLLGMLPDVAHAGTLACAPDIIGKWTGRVLDGGRIKELHTEFFTGSDQLTGRYHVEDADGGYDGTLTDFTPLGPCAGEFLWHDRHGTGEVRVDFQPDRGRFDGLWGDDSPLPDHIFTGRRWRPVPTS